jgi:hypothetical protein
LGSTPLTPSLNTQSSYKKNKKNIVFFSQQREAMEQLKSPLLDVASDEGPASNSSAVALKVKRCAKVNPNVASVLALCAIGGFADSIW